MSAHGPQRRFAAMPQDARNEGGGRSEEAAGVVAPDPGAVAGCADNLNRPE
jgi:hypothetical protein